jgi:hypothetical protein
MNYLEYEIERNDAERRWDIRCPYRGVIDHATSPVEARAKVRHIHSYNDMREEEIIAKISARAQMED